jgi:hypothetical protein
VGNVKDVEQKNQMQNTFIDTFGSKAKSKAISLEFYKAAKNKQSRRLGN